MTGVRGIPWATWGAVAGLALLYAPALSGQPVSWDDTVWLTDPLLEMPWSAALGGAIGTSRDGVYAPVLRLIFWLAHALGIGARGLHAAGIACFLGVVASAPALLRAAGVDPVPAWVATVVWAAHPILVEPVAWITGIKDTSSLLLLVLACRALLAGRDGVATVGVALALGVKAATFPIPLLFVGALAARDGAGVVARRVWPILVVTVVFAAVGASTWSQAMPAPFPWPVTAAWAHGESWRHLWPGPRALLTPVPESPWGTAALGIFATGTWAAAALRWPHLRLPLAVWIVPAIPYLGLAPLEFWCADRYLLLPTLGVATAIADTVARGLGGRAVHVLFVVVPLFALSTSGRIPDWHDSRALWEAEVRRPGTHWARWDQVGLMRARDGDFTGARDAFARAVDADPPTRDPLARLVVASLAAKGWTPARAEVAKAFVPTPPDDAAWRAALAALSSVDPDVAKEAEAQLP